MNAAQNKAPVLGADSRTTQVIRNGDLAYRIEVRQTHRGWEQRHIWIREGEIADAWIPAGRHDYSNDPRFATVG